MCIGYEKYKASYIDGLRKPGKNQRHLEEFLYIQYVICTKKIKFQTELDMGESQCRAWEN